MHWLLARQIRPFIKLAAAASLLLNLALLAPALYMLQVFDRVFASGSIETLVMLAVPVAVLLALAYCMDAARGRTLAAAGRRIESCLAPEALASQLESRAAAKVRDEDGGDALRDVAQLRRLLAGPGVVALFDAPWVPLYLLLIAAMHPLLGCIALLGALLLFGLGMFTEYATRRRAERAIDAGRATQRHAEALLRNSEVVVSMGMTGAALEWLGRALRRTSSRAGGPRRREFASRRAGAHVAPVLQVVALGFGAWLVIGREASPGIMISATILLGRALQPVELLIGGWKSMIEARAPGGGSSNAADSAQRNGWRCRRPRASSKSSDLSFVRAGPRAAAAQSVFHAVSGREPRNRGPQRRGQDHAAAPAARHPHRSVGLRPARWGGHHSLRSRAAGSRHGIPAAERRAVRAAASARTSRACGSRIPAVIRAAQLAQAHELILGLPEGYDTDIGEGGCLPRADSASASHWRAHFTVTRDC